MEITTTQLVKQKVFTETSLGDCCTILSGSTPKRNQPEYWDGNIHWFTPKDLSKLTDKFVDEAPELITQSGFDSCSTNLIPPKSLLLTSRAPIGHIAINKRECCTNQGFKSLVPGKGVDVDFLYYIIKKLVPQLKDLGNGATFKELSKSTLEKVKIPLPPLPVQKKIAAILDAADAHRQKTKALLEKYDELAQSIFLEMFGDPVKNEKGWEKVPMEQLMKIVRGGSPRPIDDFLGGTYPWIKIGDGTKGSDIYLEKTKEHITEAGLSKTRLLPAGSLIFANCGVSLGFARIITFEGCIHDGWLAFSEMDDKVLNKIFVLKALNSITRYFRETAPDGTQPNLNTSIMKNFKFIVPPISLQNKFANQLEELEKQKVMTQKSFDQAEELFNSLLQRAFKGELNI